MLRSWFHSLVVCPLHEDVGHIRRPPQRSFPSFVRFNAIDPAYFRAVGLAVTSGRAFSADDGPEAPRVTIVSQSLAIAAVSLAAVFRPALRVAGLEVARVLRHE